MPTVTYKHQLGIHATRGSVPLAGTEHLYKVTKILWPDAVSTIIQSKLIEPSLHVCCGLSPLGSTRLDKFAPSDVKADAASLPFKDRSFASVLCDPPYNGKMQWNHDMLSELSRVAEVRIIFQLWFIPANKFGYWKKCHQFQLSEVYVWQPRTYFGRAQLITIFDKTRKAQGLLYER